MWGEVVVVEILIGINDRFTMVVLLHKDGHLFDMFNQMCSVAITQTLVLHIEHGSEVLLLRKYHTNEVCELRLDRNSHVKEVITPHRDTQLTCPAEVMLVVNILIIFSHRSQIHEL